MPTIAKKMTMTPAKLAANRRNALFAGKPKGVVSSATMDTQNARKIAVAFVNERLLPLLEAMYVKAIDGDVGAFKELMDRAWGKSVQGLEVSGKDGNPIVFMPLELIQKHALALDGQKQTVEATIV